MFPFQNKKTPDHLDVYSDYIYLSNFYIQFQLEDVN